MPKWCRSWFPVLILLGVTQHLTAQPVTLAIGTPIERELAGEQSHVYPLMLETKQYLRGVVQQKGVDIIVSIVAPDGKIIGEMDTPTGTQGAEPFFAITTLAGKYQIIVRAPEKKAPVGRYEIKLEESRAATEEDQMRLTATLAFHQADRMLDEQKAEAFAQALPKFQESLSLWEKLNDLKKQAETLHNMGYTAGQLSNNAQAVQYYEKALQLRRQLGDRAGEGDSLSAMATRWATMGNFDEAIVAYAQARDIYHAIEDFAYEARILANMGQVWRTIGENQKAVEALQQALPITRSTKRPDIEAYALEGIGHAYAALGDDAIVDLTQFSLASKRMKRFRQRVGQLEKHGVRFRVYAAPVNDALLAQLQSVSDEWLQLPNRRERSFTVGSFVPDYLRSTTMFTAEDETGKVLAFVNLLVSYHPGEVTIDLMRHRLQVPNGIMDYLFVKLFEWSQAQGYTRFNLGMAPMAGFQEREEATASERIVHAFFQRANFLFSFSGIKQYKAKFADIWEPRYVVYRNVFDLPNLGLALSRITEASVSERSLLQAERSVQHLLTLAAEEEAFIALSRSAPQMSH